MGVEWVDEICRELQPGQLSAWLPWAEREKAEALGCRDEREGAAGVFVLAWRAADAELEVIYVGESGDLRDRLRQLEGWVKWRQQGPQHGFDALRDLLERRDDHRTMRRVWVKLVSVVEQPLFASPVLDARRVRALGARRRQLQAILLAEHARRFGVPVLADCGLGGMPPPGRRERPPQHAAGTVSPGVV